MTAERYTRQQARAEKRAIFKQLRQLRQEQERQRPHGTKKGTRHE